MQSILPSKLYKKVLLHYFKDNTIQDIFSNIRNGRNPLHNIEELDLDVDEKRLVNDLLIQAAYDAEGYTSNLSHSKISQVLKSIFSKVISESGNGKWAFLSKDDIWFIYNNADENYKKYFDFEALKELSEYCSNAWNTAVCLRAVLKWISKLDLRIDEYSVLHTTLIESRNNLQVFIDNEVINKFPIGINGTYNIADYCFVYFMTLRINEVIVNQAMPIDKLDIDGKSIVGFLQKIQNGDGGWPDIVFPKEDQSHRSEYPSHVNATCYALLLLNNSYFSNNICCTDYDFEQMTEKGILFLLEQLSENPNCILTNEKPDLESTCLVFQVLNRDGLVYDFHKQLLSFIKKKTKYSIRPLANNDIKMLENIYELDTDTKLIRIVSLLIITLLKAKTSVNSALISLPFSWLIAKASLENKSNLIQILCCISDYLESERNYLLYGEEGIQKEVDFIM